MKFEDIDWNDWKPKDRATLLFVRENDRLLMIHKKLGLGAGKINGPGGRIEPGETPMEAAIREVEEEVCVTPLEVCQWGELRFQFLDDYSIHGYVFTAKGYEGTPQETEEAIPLWIAIDKIPYEKMWADDALWMPLLLAGKSFDGRFLFDGDEMLGYHLESS